IAFGPLRETGDLTLLPVSPQSIRVGESAVIPVAIKRDNFTLPVQLKLTSSADILTQDVVIPSGASSAEIELTSANQAAIGPRRITVEASGGVHCAYLAFE